METINAKTLAEKQLVTEIIKGKKGITGTTYFQGLNGHDWEIITKKHSDGKIKCSAFQGEAVVREQGISFMKLLVGGKTVCLNEQTGPATEEAVKKVHEKGLSVFQVLAMRGQLPSHVGPKDTIKPGQVIFFANAGETKMVVYEVQDTAYGRKYRFVKLDGSDMGVAGTLSNAKDKLGIGYYFNEGETMPMEEVEKLVEQAQAKIAAKKS